MNEPSMNMPMFDGYSICTFSINWPIDRESADRITIEHRHVHRGFIHGEGDSCESDSEDFALVPFHELLNRWGVRRKAAKLRGASTRDEFLKFAPGDLVVHRDHGIARFEGLGLLPSEDGSSEEEVLTLAFNKNVHLHVPLGQGGHAGEHFY